MLSNARTRELVNLEVELNPDEMFSPERAELRVVQVAKQILAIIHRIKGTRASLRRFYEEEFLSLPDIERELPTDIENDAEWLAREDAPAEIGGSLMGLVAEEFLRSIEHRFPSMYDRLSSDKGAQALDECIGDIVFKLENKKPVL
jgi:hypothetical protein